jgi:hypothetical protein
VHRNKSAPSPHIQLDLRKPHALYQSVRFRRIHQRAHAAQRQIEEAEANLFLSGILALQK